MPAPGLARAVPGPGPELARAVLGPELAAASGPELAVAPGPELAAPGLVVEPLTGQRQAMAETGQGQAVPAMESGSAVRVVVAVAEVPHLTPWQPLPPSLA